MNYNGAVRMLENLIKEMNSLSGWIGFLLALILIISCVLVAGIFKLYELKYESNNEKAKMIKDLLRMCAYLPSNNKEIGILNALIAIDSCNSKGLLDWLEVIDAADKTNMVLTVKNTNGVSNGMRHLSQSC